MNICVYGAASDNIDKTYMDTAESLGQEMGRRGHTLIFGGGAHGLMGAVARGMYKEQGTVIGITPADFDVDGKLFTQCTEMIYTKTMRERKQLLEDKADGFIVLPGGIGTFDELFETLSLKKIGKHRKPIVLFDQNGYYDVVDQMIRQSIELGFTGKWVLDLYKITVNIEEVFEYMEEQAYNNNN